MEQEGVARAAEPRAVHGIDSGVLEREEQGWVVIWVVFEVGILDDDDVAFGMGESGPHGCPLAAIDRVREYLDTGNPVQHRESVVARVVVDGDYLFVNRNRLDPFDQLGIVIPRCRPYHHAQGKVELDLRPGRARVGVWRLSFLRQSYPAAVSAQMRTLRQAAYPSSPSGRCSAAVCECGSIR